MVLGNKILHKRTDITKVNNLLNGLVSVWEFNANSGSTAFDVHGSNDGTIYSASTVTGTLGDAMSFNGITQSGYIDVGDAYNLQFNAFTQSFSISMWVKGTNPAADGLNTRLIERRDNSFTQYAYTWQILTTFDPKVVRLMSYDGTNLVGPEIPWNSVWDDNWHLITHVVNNKTGMLEGWLDGVLIETVANTLTTDATSASSTFFGVNDIHTVWYTGLMDQTAVWYRALDPQDITDLYNAGVGLLYSSWT